MSKKQFKLMLGDNIESLKKLLGFGSTDLDVLYNTTLEMMPFQRPDFVSSYKSQSSEIVNHNSTVESRISEVLDKLNNSYIQQINSFVQEYN